jgi:carboxyl-terminal processing protease
MRGAGALLMATVIGLAGACRPLPYENPDSLPAVVSPPDGSPERLAMNARVYDAVVRTVRLTFYDETFNGVDFRAEAAARRAEAIAQPDEARFYEALNETLELLGDGHTQAVRPADNLLNKRRRLQTAPTFGFSENVARLGDAGEVQIFISTVREGGAAHAAGVQPGWRILSVDGHPWDDAWEGWRDRDGKTYELRFDDAAGRVHTRALEARLMPRELGTATRTPDGVLVLRFMAFDEPTADWLEARLAEAQTDRPRAIVLDIRGNGGGETRAGARMVGSFFSEPVVMGYVRTVFGRHPDKTRPGRVTWEGPLAIVQSSLSASMAEVLSATIQEQRRGRIVGQTSAGRVVDTVAFALPDGGQLLVGESEFRTARGTVLEGRGVTPDIPVVPTYDDLRHGRDPMLNAAVRAALESAATR